MEKVASDIKKELEKDNVSEESVITDITKIEKTSQIAVPGTDLRSNFNFVIDEGHRIPIVFVNNRYSFGVGETARKNFNESFKIFLRQLITNKDLSGLPGDRKNASFMEKIFGRAIEGNWNEDEFRFQLRTLGRSSRDIEALWEHFEELRTVRFRKFLDSVFVEGSSMTAAGKKNTEEFSV